MKTPHAYIVEPEGDRYNNSKTIGGKDIILNSTLDETDFKYTNRIGVIRGCPRRSGDLLEGDRVIVHHNTFRMWTNVRGTLKDSANFIKEGHFSVDLDQIFAYDRGDGWKTLEDYCFIKPIGVLEGFVLENRTKQALKGIVKYGNKILEEQGIHEGDEIYFIGQAEYVFEIDGEILWKMSAYRNVKLRLNEG